MIAGLGLAWLLALPRFNRWRIARGARGISRDLGASETTTFTVTFDVEGLRFTSETGNTTYFWSTLRAPIHSERFLVIPLTDGVIIAIPYAGVRNGDLTQFAAELRAKIAAAPSGPAAS